MELRWVKGAAYTANAKSMTMMMLVTKWKNKFFGVRAQNARVNLYTRVMIRDHVDFSIDIPAGVPLDIVRPFYIRLTSGDEAQAIPALPLVSTNISADIHVYAGI